MFDRVDEWPIDFHFDGRRGRRVQSGECHHSHCRCGCRFGSFFVHRDKGLVKDLRNLEVIVRFARRDPVEIRAALWLIERALHPERFEFFGLFNRRRFKFELGQVEIDIAPFEFCALRQQLGRQF